MSKNMGKKGAPKRIFLIGYRSDYYSEQSIDSQGKETSEYVLPPSQQKYEQGAGIDEINYETTKTPEELTPFDKYVNRIHYPKTRRAK